MDEELKWFHCTTHTYGAWLHGSERGFRTRHHREHIEGDYKNPPPKGKYTDKLERSKKLMTQDAVLLEPQWRAIVGAALVEELQELGVQLLCLSMSSTHAHLLGKMPPGPIPRKWVGLAKKHAKFACNDLNWEGKLWAVRSKIIPIKDRGHQLNTYHYILDHIEEGAWVWDFRRGVISQLESNLPGKPRDDRPWGAVRSEPNFAFTMIATTQHLRQFAASLPESSEGIACEGTSLEKITCKVSKRAYLFLGVADAMLKLNSSLPEAKLLAAKLPAHCKVGATGWVTLKFSDDEGVPLEVVKSWVEESYQLFAPRRSAPAKQRTKTAKPAKNRRRAK